MTAILHEPLLEPRVIYWFVHPSTTPPTPLGFLRDDAGGCFVIGGLTGSHFAGHSEGWWGRFQWVVSQGYVPVELAVRREIVPPEWSPPALSDRDAERARRIGQGGRLH